MPACVSHLERRKGFPTFYKPPSLKWPFLAFLFVYVCILIALLEYARHTLPVLSPAPPKPGAATPVATVPFTTVTAAPQTTAPTPEPDEPSVAQRDLPASRRMRPFGTINLSTSSSTQLSINEARWNLRILAPIPAPEPAPHPPSTAFQVRGQEWGPVS